MFDHTLTHTKKCAKIFLPVKVFHGINVGISISIHTQVMTTRERERAQIHVLPTACYHSHCPSGFQDVSNARLWVEHTSCRRAVHGHAHPGLLREAISYESFPCFKGENSGITKGKVCTSFLPQTIRHFL